MGRTDYASTLHAMAGARDLLIVWSAKFDAYGIFRKSDVWLLGWIHGHELVDRKDYTDFIDYFARRFNDLGDDMAPLHAMAAEAR